MPRPLRWDASLYRNEREMEGVVLEARESERKWRQGGTRERSDVRYFSRHAYG
jgi:hypothetical protein